MTESGSTLFIVDDDGAMLDALTTMAETIGLQAETYISAEEFLAAYDPSRRGCLVLDLRMPRTSGLDLLDELNAQNILLPVIFISGHGDVPLAVRAMKAGAIDFLEKPFKEQDLLDRIHAAFALDTRRRQEQERRQRYEERHRALTPRERELMELLVRGKAGKEMAAEMGISYKTMEKLRAGVMRKMHAGSVAELVLMAVRLGVVSPNTDTVAP